MNAARNQLTVTAEAALHLLQEAVAQGESKA